MLCLLPGIQLTLCIRLLSRFIQCLFSILLSQYNSSPFPFYWVCSFPIPLSIHVLPVSFSVFLHHSSLNASLPSRVTVSFFPLLSLSAAPLISRFIHCLSSPSRFMHCLSSPSRFMHCLSSPSRFIHCLSSPSRFIHCLSSPSRFVHCLSNSSPSRFIHCLSFTSRFIRSLSSPLLSQYNTSPFPFYCLPSPFLSQYTSFPFHLASFFPASLSVQQSLFAFHRVSSFHIPLSIHGPEWRPGMADVSSCLESQGCHLISLSYLLSCFFCLVILLFLSCHFSANSPFSWLFSPENSQIFFVKG